MSRHLRQTALAVVACIALAGLSPGGTRASDGEIIGQGSNVFGEIFTVKHSTNPDTYRLKASFAHVHDCTAGLSNCIVEVRWHSTCMVVGCWWDPRTPWMAVPDGQDFATYCPGGGPLQQWRLEVRLKWLASAVKTVAFYGQNEQVIEIGGSITYRRVAKAVVNYTNGTGVAFGYHMETTTATTDWSVGTIASSSVQALNGPYC